MPDNPAVPDLLTHAAAAAKATAALRDTMKAVSAELAVRLPAPPGGGSTP